MVGSIWNRALCVSTYLMAARNNTGYIMYTYSACVCVLYSAVHMRLLQTMTDTAEFLLSTQEEQLQ